MGDGFGAHEGLERLLREEHCRVDHTAVHQPQRPEVVRQLVAGQDRRGARGVRLQQPAHLRARSWLKS